MASARRFDASYREAVTLGDGTQAQLRLLRAEDKPLIVDGFARLSTESRYMRFFGAKDHLSDDELRYLTEIDGENHFALGAVAVGADGVERGLGVARFVRLADEPEVAELAVTVIDAAQRKGLGRILCERLMAAAHERGVRRFRAEILASNAAMLALVRGQVAATVRRDEGTTLVIDFQVEEGAPAGEAPRPALGGLIAHLLSLAAKRLVSFRRVYDRRSSG
ncbi:MAG TPA: GNAT family N-acetyltransferase [Haliangiales bacterium]|nr:GNAT family N-acetyltransferase [Haliangiales bacterium]